MLGYWVRKLADGGLVAALTATSPRRLGHPDGGPKLAGDEPARDRRSLERRQPAGRRRVDGQGDLRRRCWRGSRTTRTSSRSAARARTSRSRSRSACSSLVDALAGEEHGAVLVVARPEHDPVPALRELAAGVRLPGVDAGVASGAGRARVVADRVEVGVAGGGLSSSLRVAARPTRLDARARRRRRPKRASKHAGL